MSPSVFGVTSCMAHDTETSGFQVFLLSSTVVGDIVRDMFPHGACSGKQTQYFQRPQGGYPSVSKASSAPLLARARRVAINLDIKYFFAITILHGLLPTRTIQRALAYCCSSCYGARAYLKTHGLKTPPGCLMVLPNFLLQD